MAGKTNKPLFNEAAYQSFLGNQRVLTPGDTPFADPEMENRYQRWQDRTRIAKDEAFLNRPLLGVPGDVFTGLVGGVASFLTLGSARLADTVAETFVADDPEDLRPALNMAKFGMTGYDQVAEETDPAVNAGEVKERVDKTMQDMQEVIGNVIGQPKTATGSAIMDAVGSVMHYGLTVPGQVLSRSLLFTITDTPENWPNLEANTQFLAELVLGSLYGKMAGTARESGIDYKKYSGHKAALKQNRFDIEEARVEMARLAQDLERGFVQPDEFAVRASEIQQKITMLEAEQEAMIRLGYKSMLTKPALRPMLLQKHMEMSEAVKNGDMAAIEALAAESGINPKQIKKLEEALKEGPLNKVEDTAAKELQAIAKETPIPKPVSKPKPKKPTTKTQEPAKAEAEEPTIVVEEPKESITEKAERNSSVAELVEQLRHEEAVEGLADLEAAKTEIEIRKKIDKDKQNILAARQAMKEGKNPTKPEAKGTNFPPKDVETIQFTTKEYDGLPERIVLTNDPKGQGINFDSGSNYVVLKPKKTPFEHLELEDVMVALEQRQNGVARKLVKDALEVGRKTGVTVHRPLASELSPSGQKFFSKMQKEFPELKDPVLEVRELDAMGDPDVTVADYYLEHSGPFKAEKSFSTPANLKKYPPKEGWVPVKINGKLHYARNPIERSADPIDVQRLAEALNAVSKGDEGKVIEAMDQLGLKENEVVSTTSTGDRVIRRKKADKPKSSGGGTQLNIGVDPTQIWNALRRVGQSFFKEAEKPSYVRGINHRNLKAFEAVAQRAKDLNMSIEDYMKVMGVEAAKAKKLAGIITKSLKSESPVFKEGTPEALGRVVNEQKRMYEPNGKKRKNPAPAIHASEVKSVLKAITEKSFKLDTKGKQLMHAFTDAIHMMEAVGGQVLKETFYHPIKRAKTRAMVEFNTFSQQLDTITKSLMKRGALTKESWRNIGAYAIGQQKGGIERLAVMGKEVPTLSPAEMHMYNFFRDIFEDLFDRVNDARVRSGLQALKKEPDYFSFMGTMAEGSIFDGSIWTKNKAAAMEYVKSLNIKEPGIFKKRRPGALGAVELDARVIAKKYWRQALKHIHVTPEVARLREFLQRYTASELREAGIPVVEGRKNWGIKDINPDAHAVLTNWLGRVQADSPFAGIEGVPSSILRSLNRLNQNVAMGYISGTVSTVLLQPTSLVSVFAQTSTKAFMQGIGQMLVKDNWAKAYKESAQLELRRGSFDTSAAQFYNDLALFDPKDVINLKTLQRVGTSAMSALDNVMAVITYEVGKAEAAARGLSGKKAIEFADELVVKTQASGAFEDVSPMQSHVLGRSLTTLQTFAIANFNTVLRDIFGLKSNMTPAARGMQIAKWLAAVSVTNWFYENQLSMYGPFPNPFAEFWDEWQNKSGNISEATARALLESLEIFPVVGGIKYGSGIGGATLQTVRDATALGRGRNSVLERFNDSIDAGDSAPVAFTNAITTPQGKALLRAYGTPFAQQFAKSTNVYKQGGTPLEIITGQQPNR